MNAFYCGDCLEIMPQLPDACVDMVLADLPFGVTQNPWDQIIAFGPLWEQYKRITKPNSAIVLMATQPFASQLVMSNPKMFRYDLIWKQNKVTGFLNSKRMPLRSHCSVLIFYRQLPVYNPQKTQGHPPVHAFTKNTSDGPNYGATKLKVKGGGSTERYPTSVLDFAVVNNDSPEKVHPTQKPISLAEYLIRTYTHEGMMVLDNCVGSGTTIWACQNTNRQWIGIEKNPEYCKLIEERLATTTDPQPPSSNARSV